MSERETASTTRGKIVNPAVDSTRKRNSADLLCSCRQAGEGGGGLGAPVLGAVLGDVSVEFERLHSFHQGIHLPTVEQGKVIPSAEHQGTKP